MALSYRSWRTMTPIWLTEQQIVSLHDEALKRFGGLSGIKDRSALGAVTSRPQMSYSYNDSMNMLDMAADLAYGIATGHVFLDGNKRTAFLAAVTFLRVNGYKLKPRHSAAYSLMLQLEEGTVTRRHLASFLRKGAQVKVKASIEAAAYLESSKK